MKYLFDAQMNTFDNLVVHPDNVEKDNSDAENERNATIMASQAAFLEVACAVVVSFCASVLELAARFCVSFACAHLAHSFVHVF